MDRKSKHVSKHSGVWENYIVNAMGFFAFENKTISDASKP
jgi:hypothetical protein